MNLDHASVPRSLFDRLPKPFVSIRIDPLDLIPKTVIATVLSLQEPATC